MVGCLSLPFEFKIAYYLLYFLFGSIICPSFYSHTTVQEWFVANLSIRPNLPSVGDSGTWLGKMPDDACFLFGTHGKIQWSSNKGLKPPLRIHIGWALRTLPYRHILTTYDRATKSFRRAGWDKMPFIYLFVQYGCGDFDDVEYWI